MARAATLTLAWDPSTSSNVVGYTLKYGTKVGSYPNVIDVGNTTSFTLSSLPDGTYYFVVQAYAADGTKSPDSEYLMVKIGNATPPPSTTPPPATSTPQPTTPSTSGCTTPDPFAGMGGGTCYNGGWLPPGMTPPGTSPAPSTPTPSTPTPSTPAPSTPSPSTSGCTSPDPFAGMGGGTCYNGGWLPPGMTPPGTSPAPSKPAPATPAPSTPTPSTPAPSTPSPSTSGCTSPDPFAGMGGGTCYNGGWLPPGMTPPDSSPAPSTPAPPAPPSSSQPIEPPTNLTCVTPDPFIMMGGGTCYNGGWLPPGMEPPDQKDDEIVVTGTLHLLDAELGIWVIEAEDGTLYSSPSEIPEEALAEGAIVTFRGIRLPAESDDTELIVVEILEINITR